jgi:hypothetical protein
MNALELIEQPERVAASVPSTVATPAMLLQIAVQQGADLDKLERLMALQERWVANEARKAYSIAFAAFKAEGIKVVRNITIKDGPLKGKKHADLFSIVDAATDALSKHGLSASYRIVEDTKDWIRVACVIKHAAGHSEETTFGGPIDTGPGRNAIQARKSSVTYLERITLLLALGLAEQDADDDGAGGDGDEAALMKQLIAEAETTNTDADALAYWKANSPKLAKWPYAYEKFKQAVAAHRNTLKGGAK